MMWRSYQRLITLQQIPRFVCPAIASLCPIHTTRLPSSAASFATKAKQSAKSATSEAVSSSAAAADSPKKVPRKKRAIAAAKSADVSPEEVAKLEARAQELRGLIQRANDAYYSTAADKKPVELSDAAYDKLYKELQQIESSHPSLVTSSSPTLKPGAPSNLSQQTTVSHLLPMLSLQSCTDLADLKSWEVSVRKKLKKTADDKLSFNVELKYDGIAVSFLYEKGLLKRVLTRGTGTVGEDITEAARRWVKSLPETLQLPSSSTNLPSDIARIIREGVVEVRGEIILTSSGQKLYSDHLSKASSSPEVGEAMLASPARNVTSGLLRRDLALDNASKLVNKDTPAILDFVSYSLHLHHPSIQHVSPYIVPPQPFESESTASTSSPSTKVFPLQQSESLSILQSMTLPIGLTKRIAASKLCANLDEVIAHIATISEQRDDLDFAIDGIVIKVDDLSLAPKLGTTSHHPRGIMAFKFLAKTSTTKLISIDWQIGRSGKVVPVANLEQILIDGVVVKRASLHNLATLQELDLKIGDTVQVERRGDVIPYIAGKVTDSSTAASNSSSKNSNNVIHIPTHCPCSLKTPLETRTSATNESRCDLYCVSANCPSQNMSKLVYYCSRDAMDIGGMAKSTIAELLEKQFLTGDLLSILELPARKEEMLTRIDSGEWSGWGRKRVDNIVNNIENAHARATPVQLLTALGIPRLGASVAKNMLDAFGGSLEAVLNATPEQLEQLPGLAEKTITSFVGQFAEVRKTLLPAWKKKGITVSGPLGASPSFVAPVLANSTSTEAGDSSSQPKKKRKSTKK